jgi:hypothetical protein
MAFILINVLVDPSIPLEIKVLVGLILLVIDMFILKDVLESII